MDMDLEKFFDRVNHDILMSRLARRITDKRLLRIVRRFLQAGMMKAGVVTERTKGTPQGGPFTPLLSNILLTDLDEELSRRGHSFCPAMLMTATCTLHPKQQLSEYWQA